MTSRFKRLQDLNELLTEYAGALSLEAARSPRAMDALSHVYALQARTTEEIHSLLVAGDLKIDAPDSARQADPLLDPFRRAIARSQTAGADLGELLADPSFTEHFDRLYTILGPNTGFPDDDDPPVTKTRNAGT
jgi:hypothetical protein